MAQQEVKVKCPLCEGRAELTPAEISELFATPTLRKRLDTRIAEILETHQPAGAGLNPTIRDFQKEVHTWNPALPIWRRSPKE